MQQLQERRKFMRFRFPFCARYCGIDNPECSISAVTRDLSYGGVRLIIDNLEDLPEKYPVYLEIVFPEETLKFSAQLIWRKKYTEDKKQEAGFSFVKLPASYKEVIYKYLIKYSPEQNQIA